MFGLMFISSAAFGQSKQLSQAAITIKLDSRDVKMLHLVCARGAALDPDVIDSSIADHDHLFRFNVFPDPSTSYGVILGNDGIAYQIYLTAGDSLYFSYSSITGDTLLFDRIGANRALRSAPWPWSRNREYYHFFDSLKLDGWRDYLATMRDSLERRAVWFHTHYPGHLGIRAMLENESIEAYYFGIMHFLSENYWDSTGKPVLNDPKLFNIIDSIPWRLASFARSQEVWAVVDAWMNLKWKRFRRAAVDTAGSKMFDKEFSYVRELPSPARDVAELVVLSDCSDETTPAEEVPLLESELESFRALLPDSAYLTTFERKLDALRAKLPGKAAPEFRLPDTADKLRSLQNFRGKIVYLDFWGTWCPPCLEELDSLVALEKHFAGDTNVAFVSIALEAQNFADQRKPTWLKLISEKRLLGTQLYAEKQFNNESAIAYGISIVPSFIIIDRNGNFIDASAPRPSSGKAEAAIRSALAQP